MVEVRDNESAQTLLLMGRPACGDGALASVQEILGARPVTKGRR